MIQRCLAVLLAFCFALPIQGRAEMRIPESQAEISIGFVPLVKQAAPAVVNIYARRIVESRQSPFQNDPFFQNLFRDFGTSRPRVQNSLGSGVILSADGIVVSNYHVVGQATDIRVVLKDRREYSARVLLSDKESDLAILQLDGPDEMLFLELRDSDSVEVGELVLAIGNPFGVGQTVTSGIVSGLARSGTATGNARGYFIQTDAPINPGNSGGALVDMTGRLIGVNTSILTRSGGSNGIGFAIPSALVAQFVAQARAGETAFQRPWAGLEGQPLDADMAEGLGLDRPGGIIISDVHPDSPFAAINLRPGDVITAVDGQDVNTPPEMIYRMSVAGIGARARISYLSQGTPGEAEITLIAVPGEPQLATLTTSGRTAIPGLVVARVTASVIDALDLPLSTTGVVVADPGRAGARVGLRRGDLLSEINGQPISEPEDVEAVLSDAGRWLALDVNRGGRRIVMRLRL